jgi:DNA-binding IclR family transcriptional regulator
MGMAKVPTGESVLERAVRILEAFTSDASTLQVSEIARRADLHIATASRLIGVLVDHGLLARDAERRIGIGVRLWELASRASPTLSLREAAMPFMEDLHAVVGHHTQLGVLDGDEVLFVERLAAPGAVINITRIAGRLPLHASSSGLVLLAYGSYEMQERTLARPMKAYTKNTITTPGRLRSQLADVRRQGYAFNPGHIHMDACGIAVPIRGRDNSVLAALAVIVPNDAAAQANITALRTAARGVSRQLCAPDSSSSTAQPVSRDS